MFGKITVCIPTYNRAEYLRGALESVLAERNERVDIAICDNGSTDATESLVQEYLRRYPFIQYFRFETNRGPDRCFLKVAEMATGEYFWFLGDDDAIEAGGIYAVLHALDEAPGVAGISVNRTCYDVTLTSKISDPPVLKEGRIYRDAGACIKDLFTYFGYMSGQICKTACWKQAVLSTEQMEKYCNAYSILYVCTRMVIQNPYWIYLHRSCVKYRIDNDSFAVELGIYRRFLLDVVEYEKIATALLSASLRAKCLNAVCRGHLRARVLHIRLDRHMPLFIFQAWRDLWPLYWQRRAFWIHLVPFLVIPKRILKILRVLRKRFNGERI